MIDRFQSIFSRRFFGNSEQLSFSGNFFFSDREMSTSINFQQFY